MAAVFQGRNRLGAPRAPVWPVLEARNPGPGRGALVGLRLGEAAALLT